MAANHTVGIRMIEGDRLDIGSTVDSAGMAGYLLMGFQSLGTSEVATNLINNGVNEITGSSTAPAYTLPAPTYTGQVCFINCSAIGASGTAVVNSASTANTVSSTGANALTFNAVEGVMLVANSTSTWRLALGGGVALTSQST